MRFSLLSLIALVVFGSSSATAKPWRGLEPLRSTRADVERTLGSPEAGARNSYKTQTERVVVTYAEGECAYGWRVKPGTLISLILYPTNVLPLSQLDLDETRIEKRRDVHIESLYFYVNQQDGLNYTVDVSKGVVTAIEYYPAAKDNSLRCDVPGTPDANVKPKPETPTDKPTTTEAETSAPVYACPLHPDVVSSSREFCHRCGRRLVLRRSRPAPKPKRSSTTKPAASLPPKASAGRVDSAAARQTNSDKFDVASEYTCVMHPDIHRAQEGVCPKCNMVLVPVQPTVVGDYKVELESRPANVKPGEQAHLRFKIYHPETGQPVKDYLVTHDKLFHLFIVSRDLSVYQHIHPELESDGSFSVATVLPAPGTYKVHADVFPRSGRPQIIHREIVTAEAPASSTTLPVMIPDAEMVKTVDGMKVKLDLSASPRVGSAVFLNYQLSDAQTSQPVRDLEPYLGAWGHTLILNADQSQYLHSHPNGMIAETADRSTLRGGPEVTFMVIFPAPGDYRIWSQFQRGGKVSTVSYVVRVAP